MNIDQFRQLPLWQQLSSKAGHAEIAMIEKHVQYILPRMESYVDTFRTFTLHNREHIFNVMRIMGDLLGDQINKLTDLEAGILVLSATYHDFGMIFSEEERKAISNYEDFNREFLVQLPKARIIYEENNRQVSTDLAEWYCRWAHAVRVWPKLDEMEATLVRLLWNGVPFRTQLGYVCESHNEPAENIRVDDDRFDPDFLKQCDVRFCALLLRLADILDFDNSRSPLSVYEYLDLGNPKNKSEEISRDEWNKHMASRGFQFPKTPNSKPLFFTAATPHPYIEQGIRNFLNLIDLELRAAQKVSRFCSDKWQKFQFPDGANQDGIISNNYISSKYQFSLSEDKILDLLTGGGLYADDFVFIRELLQNSIDTVRHRVFIEHINSPEFKPAPIVATFFKDEEGYYWLRLDDEGMGMNLEIINSYLLKKGNSYYNSDLFKLDKINIHEKSKEDFVPISRFGIGLLSCFMTCDKIEISTCYYHPLGNGKLEKNRLSVEGRSGYWVIRSDQKHHPADKMPSENGYEKGYKSSIGTSIACRIKTAREFHGLDIKGQLERFLLASEVPVLFEGLLIGGDRTEMIGKPWCEHTILNVEDDFIKQCSDLLGVNFPEGIKIEIRPVDITAKSGNPNLAGQLIIVLPRIKVEKVPQYYNTNDYFRLITEGKKTFFICSKKHKDEKGNEINTELKYEISELINTIKFPKNFNERYNDNHLFNWPRISHNGIVVYDNNHRLQAHLKKFDQYENRYSHYERFCLSTSLISFRDSLLPELVVSRSTIKKFTEEITANLFYTTRELNEYLDDSRKLFTHFSELENDPNQRAHFTIEKLENSGVYNYDKQYWNSLPCMLVRDIGMTTISETFELAKQKPVVFKTAHFESRFYNEMAQYLILKNFIVSYISDGEDYYLQAELGNQPIVIENELLPFEPMEFLDTANPLKVLLKNGSLNKQNVLIKWFLNHYQLIKKDFFYFGIQLLNELRSDRKIADKIQAVNEILERLRILLPENSKPDKTLNVIEENF